MRIGIRPDENEADAVGLSLRAHEQMRNLFKCTAKVALKLHFRIK